MPDVRVGLVSGTIIDRVAFAGALQEIVVAEFRRADGGALDLSEVDVEFYERHVDDRPIADVKVRITAHGTHERLRNPDGLARRCRLKLTPSVGDATLDMGVPLPPIGYSSEEYDADVVDRQLHGDTVFSGGDVSSLGETP